MRRVVNGDSARGARLLRRLVLALPLLMACDPTIATLFPTDGVIVADDSVIITGTFKNVSAANAVITVNGEPATIVGTDGFSYTASSLEPGINPFVVRLTHAAKPEVLVRRRIVVVRGPSHVPSELVEDAASMRLNESFFHSMPLAAIVETLLADLVEGEEFYQSGVGAELVDALIDIADTLEVEISEAGKLEILVDPDVSVDGEHNFELPGPIPGSITCRMTVTLQGSFGVQGDLEPDADDPVTLAFDGVPIGDPDLGIDVDDPAGPGLCDTVGVELPGELVIALVDEYAHAVLVDLADILAQAIRLDPEIHVCADEPCPPGTSIDVAIDGEFDAADEREGGIVAEVSGRIRPLTSPDRASFRVGATLPDLGPTTPLTDRPYDLGLALSPDLVNELLTSVVAEGVLDRDVTDALPAPLVSALETDFPNLTARLVAGAAPFLDGTLVCPEGIAAPRLQAPNLEVQLRSAASPGGAPKPFLILSLDLVAGLRLRPVTLPANRLALSADFVLGSACADTSMAATVLLNQTSFADELVEAFLGPGLRDPIGIAVSQALTPLPLDALFALEADGEPLELGLQPVEVSTEGGVYQVFLNVLSDGEGGDPDVVTLEEIFFAGDSPGDLVGLEDVDGVLYLAFGSLDGLANAIYRLDPSASIPTLELVANDVFGAIGWMRGVATDGTDLYAIGGPGEFFDHGIREIRRITTGGVVSVLTSWPWDNQFASSIYAEPGWVYFQRAWNPNVVLWNETHGRSIWRVGSDGTGMERYVGPEWVYLAMTADIGRLSNGDLLGLGNWYSEGWFATSFQRYEGGTIAEYAEIEGFYGNELATPCGDDVIAVGDGLNGAGDIWHVGTDLTDSRRLSIAYPAAPPRFDGVTVRSNSIYLAAGSPTTGVQVYRLPWTCE